MEVLSALDLLLIKIGCFALLLSFIRSAIRYFTPRKAGGLNPHLITSEKTSPSQSLPPTRSIKRRLRQVSRRCVVFFGTETGTAEKFALNVAQELSSRFSFPSMVADLDDFDYTDLTTMEPDQLAIFILATYGEGEPTDNATAFDIFLKFQEAQACEAGRKPLCSLCYAAFGLGSSSYQFFNGMITKVDGAMQKCGATRIGSVGLGDDGTGTLESDFIAWRDATLSEIATHFTLEAKPYKYVRAFTVEETSDTTDMSDVFLGEPNKAHLNRKIRGPFTARNPYPAAIVEAKELFKSSDRNCLHLELDISGSTITYETGDHVALWPVNSDLEVERFLSVFGLSDKRDRVIEVISNDPTRKSPIPSRTTYETVARYYLEVCAPVSQATVAILATLVSGPSREFLQKLGSDFTLFQNQVSNKSLNLPQLLETVADDKSYSSIPFSFLLENMGRLQPRYYSISSSSLVSRKTISITAVVESSTAVGSNIAFKGVCTNYLLAAKNNLVAPPRDEKITTGIQTHQFQGPRNIYTHPTALIHVRRSKFRLPRDPKTPVVMIGPGTGIAPFRGFVQERALLASNGREIGPTLLFYGCRRREDDFLYEEEWQDLVRAHGDELRELILNRNRHVYICGDASRTAKDVTKAIKEIVGGEIDGSFETYLKTLKAARRWSEDVW